MVVSLEVGRAVRGAAAAGGGGGVVGGVPVVMAAVRVLLVGRVDRVEGRALPHLCCRGRRRQ